MYSLIIRTKTTSYTFTVPLSVARRLVYGMGKDCIKATVYKFNEPLMELRA